MKRGLILFCLFYLFIGCSTGHKYGAVKDTASGCKYSSAGNDYSVPVADILPSGYKSPEGYGTYGYVIFTKRPVNEDKKRYDAMLKIFNSLISAHDSSIQCIPMERRMVTFWPFKQNSYDYGKGIILASMIGKSGAKGPVLVAWIKPYEEVQNGDEALMLDMSDLAVEDFDKAVNIWNKHIVLSPENREPSFTWDKIKLSMHNLMDSKGKSFIAAFKIIKTDIL